MSFSTGVADGNDTLIAYGANNNQTLLSGVGIAVNSGVVTVETGFGAGQIDTLVGGFNTKDDFLLGIGTNLNSTSSGLLYRRWKFRLCDYSKLSNSRQSDSS